MFCEINEEVINEILDVVQGRSFNQTSEDNFIDWLAKHTVNLQTCLIIVQTLLDKVKEMQEQLENNNK